MAYKFQLGAFTASGSIKAEEGFDADDKNITNVGAISVDVLKADNLEFDLELADNQAAAMEIKDGSTTFQKFVSSTGSKVIEVGVKTDHGAFEVQGSNFNIDGGDIASGVTINKSPVITLGGDLGGNATLTNLGNATLTATIQAGSVEHGMLADDIISGQSELAHADILDADDLMIHDSANSEVKKVGVDSLRDHFFAAVSGDATVADGGALTIAAGAVHHSMLSDDIISGQDELAHADILDADELMISDGGVIKRVGVDSLQNHAFGKVSGDATIADGGALTIAAGAVQDGMLHDDVATGLAGDGLAASSGVLAVQVSGAVKIASDKVGLSGSIAGAGLGFGGGADSISSLLVNVDDSSIEIDSDSLQVKALGITNAMLAGSIANAKLANSSVTLAQGAGMAAMGAVALGGTVTVAVDGVLEDLDTLGPASADGEFLVATGAGAFAYESGNTARTSLGLGTGDSPQFTSLTLSGDLFVNGSTTSVSTTNLEVKDHMILIGSGSQGAGQSTDMGIVFRTGNDRKDRGFIFDQDADGGSGQFALIQEAANSDLMNASVAGNLTIDSYADLRVRKLIADTVQGAPAESIQTHTGSASMLADKTIHIATRQNSNITLTLPAAADNSGKIFKVKASGTAAGNVIIATAGSETIDAAATITLESANAAVSLVCDGSNFHIV